MNRDASTKNVTSAYQERSRTTLERALSDFSFYTAWLAHDPGTQKGIDERYAALPVLSKADIREHFPQGLVPRGFDLEAALGRGDVELVNTSGTTSEQVTNIWNQRWWDASERASWQMHPVMRHWATGSHREALLTSSRNVGRVSDQQDLSFSERRLGRFLYLNEKSNPSFWRDRHYLRMIKDMEDYQPEILEANPSYLWRLCRFALARGLVIPQPHAIVFTFERPLAYQLHYIRQAFSCPLISSYGSTELGYVFMQCQYGRLHQNVEFCRVDFQALAGQSGQRRGRILVTTFENPYYQIMRFDPGDIVQLADAACACGQKEGMVLDDIEGRFAQTTWAVDGALVPLSRLDGTMYGLLGPLTYELVQECGDTYRLRVEERVDSAGVRAGLRRLYGNTARIISERVDSIEATASGKFRHAYTLFLRDVQDFI